MGSSVIRGVAAGLGQVSARESLGLSSVLARCAGEGGLHEGVVFDTPTLTQSFPCEGKNCGAHHAQQLRSIQSHSKLSHSLL